MCCQNVELKFLVKCLRNYQIFVLNAFKRTNACVSFIKLSLKKLHIINFVNTGHTFKSQVMLMYQLRNPFMNI